MKKSTRNVIFFVFASGFVLLAPVIVLYTAGYRVSLNNRRILETGALAITTDPRGATMIIDGELQSGKSPAVIQNITPGEITVRLERKDTIPFETHVMVNGGQTTYLNTLLFSSLPSIVLTTNASTTMSAPNPNGRYIAELQENGMDEVSVILYDTVTDFSRTLIAFTPQDTVPAISWLKNGSLLVLSEEGDPKIGFTLSGERVEGASLASVITEDQGDISFFDNGSKVEVQSGEGGGKKLLALLPPGAYSVIEEADNLILARNTRGDAYLISRNTSDVVALSGETNLYDWLPDEHLILWSDGFEVNTYDTEMKVKTFVTRQSTPITAITWHKSAEAIILGSGTEIRALHLEDRETRTETTLASGLEGTIDHIWLDSASKNLYFTLKNGNSTTLYRKPLLK